MRLIDANELIERDKSGQYGSFAGGFADIKGLEDIAGAKGSYMIPKITNYRVYLNDGTCEGVKSVWIGIESAKNRTVFFDAGGDVKAVYMDAAVSHIIMDDGET